MERDWYTTAEVADLLKIHPSTALRNGQGGEIPGLYRVCKRWRWDKKTVEKYAKQARRAG